MAWLMITATMSSSSTSSPTSPTATSIRACAMTDRMPTSTKRRHEIVRCRQRRRPSAGSDGRDGVARGAVRPGADLTLSYESGVELKARSQWAYARMRFFRHRLAVVSLVVLILSRSSRSSRSRSPRTGTTSSTSRTSRPRPTLGSTTVRHRPARPRLPEPRHLRPPHVAVGRVLRRRPRRPRSGRRSAPSPATTAARWTTCSCASPTSS